MWILQNHISRVSNPGQWSSQSKNEYRSILFRESRNRKHIAESCHSESFTCFRRVFKQTVSGRQIRWRKEASNKPEKSKFVYTIPAFQNGRPPSNERFLPGGGLHVQDRSLRCIFCNTDKSKVQEIPQIQIGGTLYEFFCRCFGLCPPPLIFTKSMKAPIALLRRLNIHLITYLGDMLIMVRLVQELIFH